MSDPKIVASAKEAGRRTPDQVSDSSGAWAVLGWIGIAFLVVGGADFALTWFPTDFGNPEWEFGTVTASFNGLPILLLGLGLLLVAAEEVERPWWGTLGMLVVGLLALWILMGSLLWSMTISLALETVPEALETGVRRAVAKTALQSVVFEVLLVYLLWRWWARRQSGRERGEAA